MLGSAVLQAVQLVLTYPAMTQAGKAAQAAKTPSIEAGSTSPCASGTLSHQAAAGSAEGQAGGQLCVQPHGGACHTCAHRAGSEPQERRHDPCIVAGKT